MYMYVYVYVYVCTYVVIISTRRLIPDFDWCNKSLYDNDNISDNWSWYISLYMLRIH